MVDCNIATGVALDIGSDKRAGPSEVVSEDSSCMTDSRTTVASDRPEEVVRVVLRYLRRTQSA